MDQNLETLIRERAYEIWTSRGCVTADPRPMSSAPLDGTPVRLFVSAGFAIASFWSAERSRKAFGAGDYRAGWYLLDDDAIELDDPVGWEPLIQGRAWSERETVPLTAEPVLP